MLPAVPKLYQAKCHNPSLPLVLHMGKSIKVWSKSKGGFDCRMVSNVRSMSLGITRNLSFLLHGANILWILLLLKLPPGDNLWSGRDWAAFGGPGILVTKINTAQAMANTREKPQKGFPCFFAEILVGKVKQANNFGAPAFKSSSCGLYVSTVIAVCWRTYVSSGCFKHWPMPLRESVVFNLFHSFGHTDYFAEMSLHWRLTTCQALLDPAAPSPSSLMPSLLPPHTPIPQQDENWYLSSS